VFVKQRLKKTYKFPVTPRRSVPVYLDCNATTPVEPSIVETVQRFLTEEFGNEGSRTHSFGARAKQAVQRARDQVAASLGAKRDEVIFTSGATESNNIALLGLRNYGESTNRRHIVTTAIEHKAVLEPLEHLKSVGFEVTHVAPDRNGVVNVKSVLEVMKPETLLVSMMQVNNETGVIQPIQEIAEKLQGHSAFLHVDAAQGFGKISARLRSLRIDLISVSGHKIFAPKGVGALIARRRGFDRPPLNPIMYGGGQERSLRPGTLPVALIVALGEAAAMADAGHVQRNARCAAMKSAALAALTRVGAEVNGQIDQTIPSTLNIRFPGLDSEAVMVALKDVVAVSNGSACTSSNYTPSHVLRAMGMTDAQANECVRFSWCHLTPEVDWQLVAEHISNLRS
jgi:cysteine desulfurase